MSAATQKPSMPPRSPFVTETLAQMQAEADAGLLAQLRAGDAGAVVQTVKQELVPLDAALKTRMGD